MDFPAMNAVNDAFIEAVYDENVPEIERLLNLGIDINRTWDGASNCIGLSLHNPDLLQFLIDQGANPNHIIRDDETDFAKTAWGDLAYILCFDDYEERETTTAETWIRTLKILQNAGVEIRKPFLSAYQGEVTMLSMIERALEENANNYSENVRRSLEMVRDYLIM